MGNNFTLSEVKSVVEIGAGFGRTFQAMLSLVPSIEVYKIIDLPDVLNLSRSYLRKTLSSLVDKVEFIDCSDVGALEDRSTGLGIYIDSFHEAMEMPPYFYHALYSRS